METTAITPITPASHGLGKLSRKVLCSGIGGRTKRALVHSEHAERRTSLIGHFVQARWQTHRQIGLGSFCTHSRTRGIPAQCASLPPLGFACKSDSRKQRDSSVGVGNKCHARVNALMPLDGQRRSTPSFSSANKWLFYTCRTRPYKWHRWLQSSSRTMSCRGRSSDLTPDEFGPYPWDPLWNASDNEAVEWIQEDIITLFTTDGLIQIGGSLVPHYSSPMERKQSRGKAPVRYRRFREEDYMDPKQGLCLGAIFDIVATNGLDMGRRLCVFGFCRSVEMLSDVVEDTVLEQGGEVVVAAKGNWGGLNEKLSMRVAVPLLWGVPPAVDTLNYAIRSGGGIVEKVSCQWEFL